LQLSRNLRLKKIWLDLLAEDMTRMWLSDLFVRQLASNLAHSHYFATPFVAAGMFLGIADALDTSP
jgi:hypothetical protein